MGTAVEAITLRTSSGIVVADFTKGELKDEREILRLLEKLGALTQKRAQVQLLLNMAEVTYVSSSGLGALVGLMKKTKGTQGTMKICGLVPDVQEVFEVMQLDKIIPVFKTEDEAMASFS